jgi:hypothetical protein
MIKNEVTLDQLARLFEMDYSNPETFDIEGMGLHVQSESDVGEVYKEITNFLVKPKVTEFYQLGGLTGTGNHRVDYNGSFIHLKDHPDAVLVKGEMNVVDISVDDTECYWANGQLNHNTTSGGITK